MFWSTLVSRVIHPASLAGVLRTANWLYTAPRQTGGSNEPYAVAGRMRALARTRTGAQH
jgi:hypothetical protein